MGVLNDVSAATVFDVLNDPDYRKKWDFSMHNAFDICQISPNSDIGYYARMYHYTIYVIFFFFSYACH